MLRIPERPVLDKLGERLEYVFVATDEELAERLRGRGYSVIEAESVNEKALAEAKIGRARAVVVAIACDHDSARPTYHSLRESLLIHRLSLDDGVAASA